MIKIMYVNHCVNNDYISNLYENKVTYVWWNIPQKNLYHNYFVSCSIYIYIYVPLFHVLDKWNAYEKTMEDLHKASVHELNNGVI